MRKDKGPFIEVKSPDELRAHIFREKNMTRLAVRGLRLLDLEIERYLTSVPAEGAYFLGCGLSPRAEAHIRATGGTIFPDFRDLPFNAYRSSLYSVEELMQGYERGDPASILDTVDGKIYTYFKEFRDSSRPVPVISALAFRIHDHAIDDALSDLLHPADSPSLKVVAVMGGHRTGRDSDTFRKVVEIASRLAQSGYLVASGGGPGVMEAANLGAYLSEESDTERDSAIRVLAEQPHLEDKRYVEKGLEVRDRYGTAHPSLAIPTWFYGHEPTNLFASHVAKYFANSIREDGLLAIARHGVIFAPGGAGTIQEIFQDAAQNRYKSFGAPSPMVFFGRRYWTETKPVYPLVEALARGYHYDRLVAITDAPEEVLRFILENEAGLEVS